MAWSSACRGSSIRMGGTDSGAASRNRSPRGTQGFLPAAALRAMAVTMEAGTGSMRHFQVTAFPASPGP